MHTQVWNGRQISWNEASEFCSDCALEQLAAQFAWIDSVDANRTFLAKDIQALDFSTQDRILQVGLGKPILMNPDIPLPIREPSSRLATIEDRTPHLRIGGINGMNNSKEDIFSNMQYLLSFVPDQSIDWVHNRSHGSVVDLAEIFALNYWGYSPNTERLLSENWTAFHEENKDRPHAKYLQVCHSQGTIHVRNALAKLPKDIRDRVMVVAVAPAAVVPKESCFRSFNYACKGDIVPSSELVFAGMLDSNENDCGISKLLERTIEYYEQIIWLKPDPNANKNVHSFQNLVYRKPIEFRINDYLNNNGEYQ